MGKSSSLSEYWKLLELAEDFYQDGFRRPHPPLVAPQREAAGAGAAVPRAAAGAATGDAAALPGAATLPDAAARGTARAPGSPAPSDAAR